MRVIRAHYHTVRPHPVWAADADRSELRSRTMARMAWEDRIAEFKERRGAGLAVKELGVFLRRFAKAALGGRREADAPH